MVMVIPCQCNSFFFFFVLKIENLYNNNNTDMLDVPVMGRFGKSYFCHKKKKWLQHIQVSLATEQEVHVV